MYYSETDPSTGFPASDKTSLPVEVVPLSPPAEVPASLSQAPLRLPAAEVKRTLSAIEDSEQNNAHLSVKIADLEAQLKDMRDQLASLQCVSQKRKHDGQDDATSKKLKT